MAPNFPFDLKKNLHLEDEDPDILVQDPVKLSSNVPLSKEIGRQVWHQLQQQSHEDSQDFDPVILEALSSIRILCDTPSNEAWLKEFQGQLHDVPTNVLEEVAARAPRHFTARVADFNDNLFYEIQSERGLAHLGLASLQDVLKANDYLGSFLTTESTYPQPAHVDYTWQVLEEQGEHLQIGFFPLTNEGMFLQVWPRNDTADEIQGQVICIPYGKLLILPSRTFHGGGFRTTIETKGCRGGGGNLRFHLYLAHHDTTLPTHQTNKYTEPNDRTKELERRYVDSWHMPDLRNYLFV